MTTAVQACLVRVPALEAVGLTRRFGDRVAVDNVSFSVSQGEVFGFLGPNGAGKSSTARMLTGFLPATQGIARVAGIDVAKRPSAARRHIGVVPEEASVYADLTVAQNTLLMAQLHGNAKPVARRRCAELLETFGLQDRAAQKGRQLSKGLRQRLMLCMALVSEPDILFLDEPTSGLDVASQRMIREVISRWNRERGTTVFLTTHNMEEADELCHRVAIIDGGHLAAIDTPAALRARVAARRSVSVTFEGGAPNPREFLQRADLEVQHHVNGWRVFTGDPGALAQQIAQRSAALGLKLEAINTLLPSLEEVFVSITGGAHARQN